MEYEGLHLVHFVCGQYGHKSFEYPTKIPVYESNAQMNFTTGSHSAAIEEKSSGETYGPWTLVQTS